MYISPWTIILGLGLCGVLAYFAFLQEFIQGLNSVFVPRNFENSLPTGGRAEKEIRLSGEVAGIGYWRNGKMMPHSGEGFVAKPAETFSIIVRFLYDGIDHEIYFPGYTTDTKRRRYRPPPEEGTAVTIVCRRDKLAPELGAPKEDRYIYVGLRF